MEKEILGYKYETYEGDTLKIYRTIGFKDYHTVIALDLDSGKKVNITKQDLLDHYIRLIPDAFMNIMITDLDVAPDIYLCINKSTNLNNGKKEPDIILRQNVYSPYSDAFNTALENANIVNKDIGMEYKITIKYENFEKIKYICQNLKIEIKNVEYESDINLIMNSSENAYKELMQNFNLIKDSKIINEKIVINVDN